MERVVHYEITAGDVERARKFYEIFGWEITNSGMPGVDYRNRPPGRHRAVPAVPGTLAGPPAAGQLPCD
jgi:predicted enzyme related to lactoylglutathione lyase